MDRDQLRDTIAILQSVKNDVAEFKRAIEIFRSENYTGREWMIGSQTEIARAMAPRIMAAVHEPRQRIARNIPEVTAVLEANGLPSVWQVYPPPMFGGLVRSFNVLEAYIDVTLEDDARPNVIHLMDLLDKAIWACERQLQTNPVAEGLKAVPRTLSSGAEWFFPSQLQRAVLGWVLIALLLGLLLRYVFGLHLEDVGRLITKWVFK
jgi:hypothetical protein